VDVAVRAIIADVRARGDVALFDLSKRFDGIDLAQIGLKVTEAEVAAAESACSRETLEALAFAHDRIGAHHARQRPSDDHYVDAAGVGLGSRW
ncbi:histidinol dehydrogenase, partial [Enterococcus casseliflavus]|uniref:histidinol dehydrogenase n=1 Tax=Enterococcus casseliflavus TaxID=37734 RepID=UPI003D0C6C57